MPREQPIQCDCTDSGLNSLYRSYFMAEFQTETPAEKMIPANEFQTETPPSITHTGYVFFLLVCYNIDHEIVEIFGYNGAGHQPDSQICFGRAP